MVVSLRPVVRTIGKPRPIQFPSGICLNCRVSFYPSGFDKDGYLFTNTYLGDYPMSCPEERNQIAPVNINPGGCCFRMEKK